MAQLREIQDAKDNEGKVPAEGEPEPLAPSLFKSFLYGSPKTKKESEELEQSFSTQLMRGKYVHEIVTHKVIPEKALEYLDLVYVDKKQ